MCQVRAKLFKMVPEDETDGDTEEAKSDAPSVPSTSGRLEELAKAKKDEDDGDASPEKSKDSPQKVDVPKEGGEEGDKKTKVVQKEAGIGPVRVLKRKSPIVLGKPKEDEKRADKEPPAARVVQRQETTGGQATKVILNVRLIPGTSNVIRRGDKFVQLNAPNAEGTLESALFKVRLTSEADTLEKSLKAMLGETGEDA